MKTASVIAPSGNVLDVEACERARDLFITRGYRAYLYSSVFNSHQRFGGSSMPAQLRDFNQAVSSSDVVMCARGGYGLARLLPRIDFSQFTKHRPMICGFSDVTALNCALLARCGLPSLQSPTASVLGEENAPPCMINDFFSVLSTGKGQHLFQTEANNMQINGTLWGGNLTVLASLVGTPWMPHVQGGILFLEDVGEAPYAIERSLLQLVYSGIVSKQKAVLLGTFTQTRLSEHDFGYGLREAFYAFESMSGVPVIKGLKFGHISDMVTLGFGVPAQLTVENNWAQLKFAFE